MCEKTHVVEKWNIFGTGTIRIVLPKYGEFNVVSITESHSQLTRVLSRAVPRYKYILNLALVLLK